MLKHVVLRGPVKLCENVNEKKRYGRPVHFKTEIAELTGITSFDFKILTAVSLHIHYLTKLNA